MKLALPVLALAAPSIGRADLSVIDGQGSPFDFEVLLERARKLAAEPFRPPAKPAENIIKDIRFDDTQKIKFDPRYSLWDDGCLLYTSPSPRD